MVWVRESWRVWKVCCVFIHIINCGAFSPFAQVSVHKDKNTYKTSLTTEQKAYTQLLAEVDGLVCTHPHHLLHFLLLVAVKIIIKIC